MERIENIEDMINTLRVCLNVLKNGNEYQFQQGEMDFNKRCEYVKAKLEEMQNKVNNI